MSNTTFLYATLYASITLCSKFLILLPLMFFLLEWLTVANLEDNNTSQQVTSNIETGDEVEQQSTQQFMDGSSGIVITSRKATTKVTIENEDDRPLADHYGRFDGEFYIRVLNKILKSHYACVVHMPQIFLLSNFITNCHFIF